MQIWFLLLVEWAVELELAEDEIAYLEEPYVPHALAGLMAQNKPVMLM